MNKVYITSPFFKYTSCKNETFLIPVLIGNLSQSIYDNETFSCLIRKLINKWPYTVFFL